MSSLPGAQSTLLTDCSKAAFEQALMDFRDGIGVCKGHGMKVTAAPETAAAASERTLGVFFFAGHGLHVSGKNYLVPSDFKVPNRNDKLEVMLRDTARVCVSLDEVELIMEDANVFAGSVLLDCCRNVPDFLAELGAKRSIGSTRALPTGMSDASPKLHDVMVTFATAPGTEALDRSTRLRSHSPFTAALLTALERPLRLLDLNPLLTDAVLKDTGGKQRPHVVSTIILGLVTRGLDYPLLIVCVQSVNLLLFFNSIITLKSCLVSVAEFVHPTATKRTIDSQAKVTAIQVRQLALDLDGDGTVDIRCCFTGADTLDALRTPEHVALDAELAAAYAEHRAAADAAVAEVGALLARFVIVTEADARADCNALSRDRTRIREAKQKKKISERECEARLAKFRYCFGERDPTTNELLPTLGLMHRPTAAHTAEAALSMIVANILYCGLVNKVWAMSAVSENKQRYAGDAATTHACFGKRTMLLLFAAFFTVCCIEIYRAWQGCTLRKSLKARKPCLSERRLYCVLPLFPEAYSFLSNGVS
jgi:hypothetical protein